MNQSQDSSNKSGPHQDQKARDDMRNEGGRSGGRRIPEGDGTDEPRQRGGGRGSQRDIEREKADKGQGGPA